MMGSSGADTAMTLLMKRPSRLEPALEDEREGCREELVRAPVPGRRGDRAAGSAVFGAFDHEQYLAAVEGQGTVLMSDQRLQDMSEALRERDGKLVRKMTEVFRLELQRQVHALQTQRTSLMACKGRLEGEVQELSRQVKRREELHDRDRRYHLKQLLLVKDMYTSLSNAISASGNIPSSVESAMRRFDMEALYADATRQLEEMVLSTAHAVVARDKILNGHRTGAAEKAQKAPAGGDATDGEGTGVSAEMHAVLQDRVDECESKIESLESELDSRKQFCRKLQQEREGLRGALAERSAELSDAQGEIEALKDQLDQAAASAMRQDKHETERKSAKEESSTTIKLLRAELEDRKRLVDELDKRLEQGDEELEKLEKDRNTYRDMAENLSNQLRAVMQSAQKTLRSPQPASCTAGEAGREGPGPVTTEPSREIPPVKVSVAGNKHKRGKRASSRKRQRRGSRTGAVLPPEDEDEEGEAAAAVKAGSAEDESPSAQEPWPTDERETAPAANEPHDLKADAAEDAEETGLAADMKETSTAQGMEARSRKLETKPQVAASQGKLARVPSWESKVQGAIEGLEEEVSLLPLSLRESFARAKTLGAFDPRTLVELAGRESRRRVATPITAKSASAESVATGAGPGPSPGPGPGAGGGAGAGAGAKEDPERQRKVELQDAETGTETEWVDPATLEACRQAARSAAERIEELTHECDNLKATMQELERMRNECHDVADEATKECEAAWGEAERLEAENAQLQEKLDIIVQELDLVRSGKRIRNLPSSFRRSTRGSMARKSSAVSLENGNRSPSGSSKDLTRQPSGQQVWLMSLKQQGSFSPAAMEELCASTEQQSELKWRSLVGLSKHRSTLVSKVKHLRARNEASKVRAQREQYNRMRVLETSVRNLRHEIAAQQVRLASAGLDEHAMAETAVTRLLLGMSEDAEGHTAFVTRNPHLKVTLGDCPGEEDNLERLRFGDKDLSPLATALKSATEVARLASHPGPGWRTSEGIAVVRELALEHADTLTLFKANVAACSVGAVNPAMLPLAVSNPQQAEQAEQIHKLALALRARERLVGLQAVLNWDRLLSGLRLRALLARTRSMEDLPVREAAAVGKATFLALVRRLGQCLQDRAQRKDSARARLVPQRWTVHHVLMAQARAVSKATTTASEVIPSVEAAAVEPRQASCICGADGADLPTRLGTSRCGLGATPRRRPASASVSTPRAIPGSVHRSSTAPRPSISLTRAPYVPLRVEASRGTAAATRGGEIGSGDADQTVPVRPQTARPRLAPATFRLPRATLRAKPRS